MFRRALTGLLVLAFATPAWADAQHDVRAAFVHSLELKAFRASMTDLALSRTLSVVEFQAPDRYRITAGGRPPSTIIGETMYLNNAGKIMKVPLPKQMLGQFRNEATIKELEKNTSVESLGPGMVGTEAAKKYRFTSKTEKQSTTSIVWIGVRNGYVLQVDSSGTANGKAFSMRVLYSDFDSPAIKINAPS